MSSARPPSLPPDDPILLVHAYLDGELDAASALEMERRVAADPALAAECRRIEMLRGLIAERLPRDDVPPALRARIESAVGLRRAWLRPAWPRTAWIAVAASIALTAMVATTSTWLVAGQDRRDLLADAILAAHIRGLMAAQPADVLSADRHTVKPWFNGRIPEAPRVIDLSRAGFPLVGGRLDVISRRAVPTLIYRRRQHLISLTAVIEPGDDSAAPVRTSADGYNLVTWTDGGTSYWAVSDVAAPDLQEFVRLFRTES